MMIGAAGAVLILAATLTFAGLRDSVVYFVAPSELSEKAQPGQRVRLGGLVVEGTVRREADATFFQVTDGAVAVDVRYEGLLPDLFREGQGVVAALRHLASSSRADGAGHRNLSAGKLGS